VFVFVVGDVVGVRVYDLREVGDVFVVSFNFGDKLVDDFGEEVGGEDEELILLDAIDEEVELLGGEARKADALGDTFIGECFVGDVVRESVVLTLGGDSLDEEGLIESLRETELFGERTVLDLEEKVSVGEVEVDDLFAPVLRGVRVGDSRTGDVLFGDIRVETFGGVPNPKTNILLLLLKMNNNRERIPLLK
jgi:hypothetical protein